jgi:phytanoyl-CoA hydroxylase
VEGLSAEQREQFYRDGYIKYGRVIDDATVERLRAALDRTIEEELTRDDYSQLPPEFAFGHKRKADIEAGEQPKRAIHQFVNIWKVVPEYRDVINNPNITSVIRNLMDDQPVRLWHDQIISKPPGDNGHFACHHDFYFWPLDRPSMITCWLALDDATPDNGCMHVAPQSHRDPRYQPADCELTEDLHLSPAALGPGEAASLYNEIRTWMPDKAKPVVLKAGECMFHHCLNYHMTPPNITDRQRRAFVMIYMPDGTRYKKSQSPNHPCTSYLPLVDGEALGDDEFPLCG